MMDDFDDIKDTEFVTDTDDQDSLDEKIDSEQRIRNHQLWASFQNAACCITKLYRDRSQANVSPWIPFQNAASNLTTLYKDCIESQKRFARLGYQVGRRRRSRELKKFLKKHQLQVKQSNQSGQRVGDTNHFINHAISDSSQAASSNTERRHNTVSSILAVNQLNLDCDEMNTTLPNEVENMSNQLTAHQVAEQQHQLDHLRQHHSISQTNNQSQNSHLGNTEEDLVTFQQALVQPITVKSIKMGHNMNRRPSINSQQATYMNSRSVEATTGEEDRLLELNQFLSEEYHRHVGSRKRSCSSIGGNVIKRARE